MAGIGFNSCFFLTRMTAISFYFNTNNTTILRPKLLPLTAYCLLLLYKSEAALGSAEHSKCKHYSIVSVLTLIKVTRTFEPGLFLKAGLSGAASSALCKGKFCFGSYTVYRRFIQHSCSEVSAEFDVL